VPETLPPLAAFGGRRRVPAPVNEPVKSYAPGSPEKAEVKARLKLKEIEIVLDEAAHEFVINKGDDPTYGARPMRRAVERFLEGPLAEELLKGTVKAGDIVQVKVAGDDKLSFHAAEPHRTAASAS